MYKPLLAQKLEDMKVMYENAIRTGQFTNAQRNIITTNGAKAKKSLTTSSQFINKLHEVVKISVKKELRNNSLINANFKAHPRIGKSKPEKIINGYLKAKKQDVVFLFDTETPETIQKGPLKGEVDKVGKETTKKSIILGVRSQLSSIDKNFDTLMERAYAEALNVRLRTPETIMGEVFLLPVNEYTENVMQHNRVEFSSNKTKIKKYLSIFNAISNRKNSSSKLDYHKYERSCILIVDFQQSPVKIYETLAELKQDGIVPKNFRINFSKLSPVNFSSDLIRLYRERHGV